MRAFVTGGTGFIGGRLIGRLRERGDDVVALVRSPDKATRAARARLRVGRGRSLLDEAIRRGVQGATPSSMSAAVYKVGIPASRARRRCGTRTCAAPSGCSTPRSRRAAADRLRLDRRRVRQHQRRGRGRELQPSRRGLPLLLRRDQVPLAPGGARPHREGRAGRDRAAGRRLRPRRPLRDRQHHRPDPDRQAQDDDVPGVRVQPRACGRRRGRDPARARQGRGGRVATCSAARCSRCATLVEKVAELSGRKAPERELPAAADEAGDPDRPAGRARRWASRPTCAS